MADKDEVKDFLGDITKEELDLIQADPRLSKIYKSMEAGLTKKFQSLADERRTFGSQLDTLKGALQERESTIGQWNTWFKTNFPEGLPEDINFEEAITMWQEGRGNGDGVRVRGKGVRRGKGDEITLDDIAQGLVTLQKAMIQERDTLSKGFMDHVGKQFDIYGQLFGLSRKYGSNPKYNESDLIKYAVENKITDLEKAYGMRFQDDILKSRIDEGVKTQLESEKAKASTNVTTGSEPATQLFKKPDSPAKGWGEVREAVGKDISSGTAGKGGEGGVR